MKLLDGRQLIKQDSRNVKILNPPLRSLLVSALQETGFVEYLDVGTWYLAFYNDGRKMEQVMVYSTPIGERPTTISFFLHLNAFLFNISKLITS